MKKFETIKSTFLSGAALSALLVAPGALAQENDNDEAPQAVEIEEVIVTARRRSESLLSVPAAVTTFTEQTIQDAGIDRPSDFIGLTSNVNLVETQNTTNAFIVVRGISQARNSEPSVAVIIDGVQQASFAQFSQELFDVQQIEVLKGPQGALYGRNAIGGAIVITTQQPSDELEGQVRVGVDNGFGYRAQAALSGPVGDSDTLKFRLSASYYDTDGFIPNEFLGEEADPFEDFSVRGKLLWLPNDRLSVDLRASASFLRTQGFYFNIVNDVNDTSLPVRVNNPGQDNRDMYSFSAKVEYETDFGTLSSITSYDDLESITTGDAFNFLPIEESLFNAIFGFDLNQSQFFDLEAWSQELKFTSREDKPVRWIVGGYMIGRDRFISTGNMIDTGAGVFPVFREPSTNPLNPQFSFLSDAQDNFAWALFGDVVFDVTEDLELDLSLRYDRDRREQTTLTPTAFLPNVPGFPQASTGDVRKRSFDSLQPKVTLRYNINENASIYGGYSKGFRSGGFNQTGVGGVAFANGIVGVNDIFEAETADTWEIGLKGQFLDGRLRTTLAAYTTETENSYFFVFLAANSTQNLGTIPKGRLTGFELDANLRLTSDLDFNVAFGLTDSEIKEFADPTAEGNEMPLVSRYTFNAGLQYTPQLGNTGLNGLLRIDYRRIGKTWWEPFNTTVRSPVDLVDIRVGVEGGDWSITAWGKNALDEKYNAEFSPGGFVFKAPPARYGLEARKRF